MANMNELAIDMEVSPDGLMQSAARIHFTGQAPEYIDASTALASSATRYSIVGIMPCKGTLINAVVRSDEKGVSASSLLNILKAASGTALASGTAIVTQLECDDLTDATNWELTPTAGDCNLDKGDMIIIKHVAPASEVLEPLGYDLEFQV